MRQTVSDGIYVSCYRCVTKYPLSINTAHPACKLQLTNFTYVDTIVWHTHILAVFTLVDFATCGKFTQHMQTTWSHAAVAAGYISHLVSCILIIVYPAATPWRDLLFSIQQTTLIGACNAHVLEPDIWSSRNLSPRLNKCRFRHILTPQLPLPPFKL